MVLVDGLSRLISDLNRKLCFVSYIMFVLVLSIVYYTYIYIICNHLSNIFETLHWFMNTLPQHTTILRLPIVPVIVKTLHNELQESIVFI